MFITSPNEIISLMPTARWDKPSKLYGYLEEEERVALEPLLGTALYQKLCQEYQRLKDKYGDITASTINPAGKARKTPGVPYADVTERLDAIQSGFSHDSLPVEEYTDEVPEEDMMTIRLIRICQQIEFYKMISHKAGLLTVSFNDGGGANRSSADGYEPADDKDIDRMTKDAFMSAGRSTDSLLLLLEADAKDKRLFTEMWQEADAFYLHKDLLFQTARVLNEYLDIKGDRMAYVQLVRDIRFCQMTYLRPRIGSKLLKAAVDYANVGTGGSDVYDELVDLLRQALAFFVESRRQEVGPRQEKLARRDSMTDAMQAMAEACQYIEDNLDALGEAAVGTPIYNAVREREARQEWERNHAAEAMEKRRMEAGQQQRKRLFTAFPPSTRTTDHK